PRPVRLDPRRVLAELGGDRGQLLAQDVDHGRVDLHPAGRPGLHLQLGRRWFGGLPVGRLDHLTERFEGRPPQGGRVPLRRAWRQGQQHPVEHDGEGIEIRLRLAEAILEHVAHPRQRRVAEHARLPLEGVQLAHQLPQLRLRSAPAGGHELDDALSSGGERAPVALTQGSARVRHPASSATSNRWTTVASGSACPLSPWAEVRVWDVAAAACVTTSLKPRTLSETCSVPLRCCWETKVICRAASVVARARRRPSSVAMIVAALASRMSARSFFTSSTDAVTRTARRRISAATRAKP